MCSMTSPKISADKANANASSPSNKQDVAEVSNGNAAAPGSSVDGVAAAANAENATATAPYGVFSWLKVFRFANLMIKQGC